MPISPQYRLMIMQTGLFRDLFFMKFRLSQYMSMKLIMTNNFSVSPINTINILNFTYMTSSKSFTRFRVILPKTIIIWCFVNRLKISLIAQRLNMLFSRGGVLKIRFWDKDTLNILLNVRFHLYLKKIASNSIIMLLLLSLFLKSFLMFFNSIFSIFNFNTR